MRVDLYPHQKEALTKLRSGSILCGGVGTGKSRTALIYFFEKECDGFVPYDASGNLSCKDPKDLYIITTARKRDTKEWDEECAVLGLSQDQALSFGGIKVIVDSWNNIKKYNNVYGAFFIFDEQRVVGSGTWVKSFLRIAKRNRWILLSATPGDTWMDYVPVFVANGYFQNKTEFCREHVIFNRFTKYPKIDRYVNTRYLESIRDDIVVTMTFDKIVEKKFVDIFTEYDKELYKRVVRTYWNVYKDEPIKQAGEFCQVLRRIVNLDESRDREFLKIFDKHHKLIVFYNFDYELDHVKELCESENIVFSEWNGHSHQEIPNCDEWIYLVQYMAGAEGWNCITSDTCLFWSLNYSYKIMTQSAGRIDRINTPFKKLYYYTFLTRSSIDSAIKECIGSKKKFNEKLFEINNMK